MRLFLNVLLHSFLTSTQNAATSSLSSYFTNGHHHPSSLLNCFQLVFLQNCSSPSSLLVITSQLLPTGLLTELVFSIVTSDHHFSTAPNWSSYRTDLLNRNFWSSLLNCSQLVFLQNWSSPSSLLVVTPQFLPTGLLTVHLVTELVFPNIDFPN